LISFKLEQPSKASFPIIVTESGIVIDLSNSHSLKVLSPILVTESGIVMDSSELHHSNVDSSISVTE